MYVKAKCEDCGEVGFLNLGSKASTLEEAVAYLAKWEGSECPWGGHFRIDGIKFVDITLATEEELAAKGIITTDEEMVAKLVSQGYDVFTTDDLYGLGLKVTGYIGWADMCHGYVESTGEKVDLLYLQSPSGKRLYYIMAGKLQPKVPITAEG